WSTASVSAHSGGRISKTASTGVSYGRHGDQTPPLQQPVGEAQGPPLLARREGADGHGHRLRARSRAALARKARSARGGHGPAEEPGDPVRGRSRVPRGAEGQGAANPRGTDEPAESGLTGAPRGAIARLGKRLTPTQE